MARTPRDRFDGELDRIRAIDDGPVRDALTAFARAVDPERTRPTVPKPRRDGTVKERVEIGNGTAKEYLQCLRLAHERGCDLLGVDADGFNTFMDDLVDGRLDDYDGRITKPTGKKWQAAARAFYRFCGEPGADGRPDVRVEWPADRIIMYSATSTPMYGSGDMYTAAEVDALREATLKGENPRRDRAFIELLAGTVQRVYAIVTLRVGDVQTDPDRDEHPVPYVLLNEAIDGDGDKGAIRTTGRYKPVVSDIGPVRAWLDNHPYRDADVRREFGAPDRFADCYVFVGDLSNDQTIPTDHWSTDAAESMLKRVRGRTGRMPTVPTVDKQVTPHGFRHWSYTKSKELPIDEDIRRKVYGWAPGSDEGDRTYGHVEGRQAAEAFAEAWADAFGDAGSVPEAIDSTATEQIRALASIMADSEDDAIRDVGAELTDRVLGSTHDESSSSL